MKAWLSAWPRAALLFLLVASAVLCCGCGGCVGTDRVNPLPSCAGKPDGSPCDDATACTQGDRCQAGTCVAGNPVTCAAAQCNDVACDPSTGACVRTPVADGSACSDGSACTLNESCQSGYCVPESSTICTASDVCHEAGACDPATGACSNPPIFDGATCDDGKTTTARDVCIAGACTGYSAIDVVITTPANNTVTKNDTIQVTGTISEAATVTIGTTPVNLTGLSFSATVPLEEGSNVLAVQAKATTGGNIGGASTVVLRDTTPPRLTILSPSNNALLVPGTTTVTGIVQDLVLGTVNAGDCTVTVNGIQAVVENRAFRAAGVPVMEGDGTVTAIAADSAGNKAAAVIRVVGDARPGDRIGVASGDAQSGIALTLLAQPLTAFVKDNAGAAVPGVEVTFRVTRGNGTLGGGARMVKAMSDAAGLASATLTLGSRAGIAQNQVAATATGFLGTAMFSADGLVDPASPRTLSVTMGGIQRGLVSSLLPQPLVVVLADDKGNAVSGADVTFTVIGGGGLVHNQPSITLKTDADGRAFVLHALGPGEGIGTQVVEATSPGAAPAHFASSAYKSNSTADTTLTGLVLSNQNHPIANVLLSIKGTTLTAVSDAEGHFEITGVPAGHIHLDVDGTTAGPYPPLRSLEMDTLPGIANEVDRPIYLPLVDIDGIAMANVASDVVIRRKDLPGFEMRVPAGSATFKNMSKTGLVHVIRVHRDKVPMLAPDGTLPTIAFAIMPADVHFDPPAAIRFPNVDGRAPGEIVTIYSFDHDLYEFVAIGTATVSEDGQEVMSEPGQGIVKGGWHHAPPVAAVAGAGKCASTGCKVHSCKGSSMNNAACELCSQSTQMSTMQVERASCSPSTLPGWAPDGDCYNSGTSPCGLPGKPCAPEPVPDRSCIRGYNGVDGDVLVTVAGTCVRAAFAPQFDSKNRQLPVCCPAGHFCTNPAGCPLYGGQSVCCEKPCNAAGCCQ